MSEFVMTAIQAAPVHFDREASTEKACRLIAEAADKGATIAAFGECWIPGYPMFAYASSTPLRWKASAAYIASAVEIPGVETEQLCKSTKKAKIDVVIGVAELDERTKSTVLPVHYTQTGRTKRSGRQGGCRMKWQKLHFSKIVRDVTGGQKKIQARSIENHV